MKRMRRYLMSGLAVVLLATMLVVAAPPKQAEAASQQVVTITITAATIAITNSQGTWNIGNVEISGVVYFSADNTQDDNYSTITNTGNVNVDVELRGTDLEGGDYDWVLADNAGVEIYSLYADNESAGTYSVEIQSSGYTDITANLATLGTVDWSMKLDAPTSFNASDDGSSKSGSVTLVATATS